MSKNQSCHSEEHPKGTCFAARSDVGIRNLLVANSQKRVRSVRFGNGLPRQSADWLAMTGFFDSLTSLTEGGEGSSAPRRGMPPAGYFLSLAKESIQRTPFKEREISISPFP